MTFFFSAPCFLSSSGGPIDSGVPWKQRHVCFSEEAEKEDPRSAQRG